MKNTISLINSLSEISTKTLLIEVKNFENLNERLQNLGIHISQKVLEKIQNRDEDCRFLATICEDLNFLEIVYFFPREKYEELDRSEVFAKYTNNICVVFDGNDFEGYETFALSTYRFLDYKTQKENDERWVFLSNPQNPEMNKVKNRIEAIYNARNRINMPAQDLNPESIVQEIVSKNWNHFEVKVFGDNDLREMGCNLIRAVGQGSSRESFMVILEPKNPKDWEKYACIGKGVTFDAGGIQIKPDRAMIDMKCDMAGAAGILGVAEYLDTLDELPANVIFGMAFVENMTGPAAFKPLDIFTAYNGTNVEIHHTDAEWRLVLADVMSYIDKNYGVNHMITMATLTGACIYAVWNDIAWIMGDDDKVISDLFDHSSLFEAIWRLPLTQKMKDALKSNIADIKNLSDTEKAGSSVGGAFLSYFQWKSKLTHLDIAGPAFRTNQYGPMTVGGTGWWVKILTKFFENM